VPIFAANSQPQPGRALSVQLVCALPDPLNDPLPLPPGFPLPCWCSFAEAGQKFEEGAAQMLALGRDGISFAQLTPADELQAVLADADRLCLRVRGGQMASLAADAKRSLWYCRRLWTAASWTSA
jgi:hypothetical protein